MNRSNKNGAEDCVKQQARIRSRCFHAANSFIEFEKSAIEQSVAACFEEQVKKYPQRLAIKDGEAELTYEMLNGAANRVAHAIIQQHGTENKPIAIVLENGIPAIVAILGALKARKIYVPLDPRFPRERILKTLKDAQADLVLINSGTLQIANKLGTGFGETLNIDEIDPKVSTRNPELEIQATDPCCIYYTSGSTGKPKGIVHTHRNLLHNILTYTNAFHVCADDRLTLLHTYSFSASLIDAFCALLNGASVLPWDYREQGLTAFAEWMIREKITIFHWVPTPFRHFAQTLRDEQAFASLRLIVLGSEQVLKNDIEIYKSSFPADCIFINRFGSTEAFAMRMYYLDKETEVTDSVVPIGFAVDDKEVLLLDDDGREVQEGEIGEIAVKSEHIAMGYWKDPELTDASFTSLPGGRKRIFRTGDLGRLKPDGCLLHLGRKDLQTKIRGYRVETSEIVAALQDHPYVQEVAVVARKDERGTMCLLAYVVPSAGFILSFEVLRGYLKDKLPDYMVPSVFVTLEALPLTPRGKLDLNALPACPINDPGSKTALLEARTPAEKAIARIWSEVLKLQRVGVHQSFFELGGDSLLGTQVLYQIGNEFQVELSLREFSEMPTIAGLAGCIVQREAAAADQTELEDLLAELEELSDDDVQRLLTTDG